ncbi:pre-mRNA-processing factor 19 [Monosporozyma servazzii]
MFCAISGKPPLHPVVSTKSRTLFEKSLLVQYVNEHGTDPISKDPMTTADILEIDTKLANTNTNALNSSTLNSNYSIPNLLSTLQNEWDAIMQENFLLRQKLDILSKNLSQALYERDAAKIIAAKYMSGEKITLPNTNRDGSQIDSASVNTEQNGEITSNINYELLVENSKKYMITTKPAIKTINSLQKNLLKNIQSFKSVKLIKSIEGGYSSEYPNSTFPLKNVSSNFSNYIVLNQNKSHSQELISLDIDKDISFSFDAYLPYFLPSEDVVLFTDIEQQSCGIYDWSDKEKSNCHLPNERIIGLFGGEGVYSDIIPDNVSKQLLYIAACASGSVYLINKDQSYPMVKGTSNEDEDGSFYGAAFHKDGLLVAFFNSKDIKIVNISKPNDSPISVPMTLEGKSIDVVRFSANGYWLFVGVDGSVFTYDLRKSPMTCIKTDTAAEGKAWDVIPSGKIMATVNRDSKTLVFHEYEKNSNSWKVKNELNIVIPEPAEKILSLTLLYSNDKLGCLIFTPSKSYKFILEES